MSSLRTMAISATILTLSGVLLTQASGDNGIFGDYFTNMIQTCSSSNQEVVTGFDEGSSDYGTIQCSPIATLLADLFSSSTAPEGQAVIGFSSTGELLYGDVGPWKKNGLAIYYTGGNVGVGTGSPVLPLHIYRDTDDTPTLIKVENTSNGTHNDPGIIFKSRNSEYSIFANDENNQLYFWDLNATARMTIDGTGNVGIGTFTPHALLDVAGDVIVSGSITIPHAPIAGTDAVNKDYVDAAVDAAGGGGLTLYKSDGVTKVGKFITWLTSADVVGITNSYPCDRIVYSSGGIITYMSEGQCEPLRIDFYYTSVDCTGQPYSWTYSFWNYSSSTWYRPSRFSNYDLQVSARGVCSPGLTMRSMRNANNGSCSVITPTNSGPNCSNFGMDAMLTIPTVPRLCGGDRCQIK